MATFRGTDGSVSVSASTVTQVREWSMDVERDFIDETFLGATAEEGSLDIPAATGQLQMDLDYDDAAQAALVDQAVAGTVPTALAVELLAATGKKFTGNILIERASIAARTRGGNITLQCNYRFTGGVTVDWT